MTSGMGLRRRDRGVREMGGSSAADGLGDAHRIGSGQERDGLLKEMCPHHLAVEARASSL